MKCLLCSSTFKDQETLLNHYLTYHNIDQNNWFFQKLFQAKNKILLKNCVRCSKFLTTEKYKATHDFLEHYDSGKNIPFEEKPLDILIFPGSTIYSIDFQKHNNFYNFYNSEKCVDDFLKNVKYKFVPTQKIGLSVRFTLRTSRILLHLIYDRYLILDIGQQKLMTANILTISYFLV